MRSNLFLFRTVGDACPYNQVRKQSVCAVKTAECVYDLLSLVGTGVLDCPSQFSRAYKPTKKTILVPIPTKKQVGAVRRPTCFYLIKEASNPDIHQAAIRYVPKTSCVKFFGSTFLPRKVERVPRVPSVPASPRIRIKRGSEWRSHNGGRGLRWRNGVQSPA